MQTIELGDTVLEIHADLAWQDEDGTLVAYLPETDFVNLRFSLLTIADKAGHPVPGAGVRAVMSQAVKAKLEVEMAGDKVWCYDIEPSSDGTPDSSMHYWYVGLDEHMLIASCFVDAAMASDPRANLVMSSVPSTVRSFRKLSHA